MTIYLTSDEVSLRFQILVRFLPRLEVGWGGEVELSDEKVLELLQ